MIGPTLYRSILLKVPDPTIILQVSVFLLCFLLQIIKYNLK